MKLLVNLAETHQQLQQPQQARILLDRALVSSQLILEPEQRIEATTLLAEAYLDLNDREQAMTLIHQASGDLEEVSYPPQREVSYSQVAIAYIRAGEIEPALELIPRIEIDDYLRGLTQLEVVQAYLQDHRLTDALTFSRTITRYDIQVRANASIAEYSVDQGNLDLVDDLFAEATELTQADPVSRQEMLERYAAIQPAAALPLARSLNTPEARLATLAAIARHYEVTDQTTEAVSLLEEVVATLQQIPADWQNFEASHLIDKAIAAGAYQQAIQLVSGMVEPYIDSRADQLGEIAYQATIRGNREAAQQAIAQMPENVSVALSHALQRIARFYVRQNQVDEALAVLQANSHVVRGAYRVQVLAAIAAEVYLLGGIDPATPLFAQILQAVEDLPQPGEQVTARLALAQAYGQTAQSAQALEQLEQVRQVLAAASPDDFSLVTGDDGFNLIGVLQLSIENFSEAEQHDLALQVAQMLPEFAQGNYILQNAIEQAIAAEQYESVLPYLEKLELPETQTRILLRISDRYQQSADREQALALLSQALTITHTIPDPESRVLVFGNEGGTVVEDDFDRASLYEKIALRYIQMGQLEDARQVMNQIQDVTIRDRVTQRMRCWSSQL